MGRKKLPVDEKGLRDTIESLEKNGPLRNLFALQEAVANSQWGQNVGISAATVYSRIKEFKIETKTQPGKRGVGAMQIEASLPQVESRYDVKNWTSNPDLHRHQDLIQKAGTGDLLAIVALKCIDCSGGYVDEVTNCECRHCPLYTIRPFQK